MPTPVNHLVMAQELLQSRRLPPWAQHLLEAEHGAFLLGHTAPDLQTVSGQKRHETHFYTLPPTGDRPAYRAFLDSYPELDQPGRLASAHAAFLSGYLAHLLADEAWWREVFSPVFGPQAAWSTWEDRLFLHNVLRTWLDLQDQARLSGTEAQALALAQPAHWLPFVRDEDLRSWRDLLVGQLLPGRRVRTAEVFALRMAVPSEAVEDALRSDDQMAVIFQHVPMAQLDAYRSSVLEQSLVLIETYLRGGP